MSDWSSRNAYLGRDTEEKCNYCGCVYRVVVSLQDGHNETEEYYCPDCHKEYKTRACNSPLVSKISGRTDGKTIKHRSI